MWNIVHMSIWFNLKHPTGGTGIQSMLWHIYKRTHMFSYSASSGSNGPRPPGSVSQVPAGQQAESSGKPNFPCTACQSQTPAAVGAGAVRYTPHESSWVCCVRRAPLLEIKWLAVPYLGIFFLVRVPVLKFNWWQKMSSNHTLII